MDKQEIILKHVRDKKSRRCISRETGFARKTVDKYIKEYEVKLAELGIDLNDEIRRQELIKNIVEEPSYKTSTRTKYVVTDKMIERIEFYLNENKIKRLTGLSKQEKKKKDIFESLVDEGFETSYSTVLREIKRIEKKASDAYIKQEYSPGEVVEFDWGNIKLNLNGEGIRDYQLAVFTTAYSNFRFAKLFPKQNSQCFLEAHNDFFEYTGGSFAEMVYDNMRVAVKKFVSRTEKEPTEDLLKLSLYYRFNFRFCNARSGNEKGHVERSVEVIRRKAFAKKHDFESLEDANRYLLVECEKINSIIPKNKEVSPQYLFDNHEKPTLLPTFGRYEVARLVSLRVDKYSTISVDTCHYSVPDYLTNKVVDCKIYSTDILVFLNGELVAKHKKNHGLHKWIMDINHYLDTLRRKPGALPNSCAFAQSNDNIRNIYSKYFINKEKHFIELLKLIGDIGIDKVLKSISMLEELTPINIDLDKIKFISTQKGDKYLLEEYLKSDSDIVTNSKSLLNAYSDIFLTGKDDAN